MIDKLKKQADYFGTEDRLCQLMEECGELIQAANKYRRTLKHDPTLGRYDPQEFTWNIMEEMADVSLLIKEVAYLLNLDEEGIAWIVDDKISRTELRLQDD